MSKQRSSTSNSEHSKSFEQTSSWRLLPKSYRLFIDNALPATVIAIGPAFVLQLGATLSLIANDTTLYQLGLVLQSVAFFLLIGSVAAAALLQLRAVQGKDINLYQLFRDSFVYWPRIVGFSLLFALMLVVGFVLLIIPGLIVLRRYILTPYFIIDKDLGIREAMQHSAAASKPISKHIWTMLLIIFGFSGLGILCTKLSPEYGGFVSLLFSVIYNFLPPLRYQEAVENLRMTEEK